MELKYADIMALRSRAGIAAGIGAWNNFALKHLDIDNNKTGWIHEAVGMIVDDEKYKLALRDKDLSVKDIRLMEKETRRIQREARIAKKSLNKSQTV